MPDAERGGLALAVPQGQHPIEVMADGRFAALSEDHAELVATDSADVIAGARRRRQARGERTENRVAVLVTAAVVELLEVIDVDDHDDIERCELKEAVLPPASVADSRERVSQRLRLGLFTAGESLEDSDQRRTRPPRGSRNRRRRGACAAGASR